MIEYKQIDNALNSSLLTRMPALIRREIWLSFTFPPSDKREHCIKRTIFSTGTHLVNILGNINIDQIIWFKIKVSNYKIKKLVKWNSMFWYSYLIFNTINVDVPDSHIVHLHSPKVRAFCHIIKITDELTVKWEEVERIKQYKLI